MMNVNAQVPKVTVVVAAVLLVVSACGGGGSAETEDIPEMAGDLSTSREAIAELVRGSGYRSWVGDPAVRGALENSPHGKVRVFFNEPLVSSLRAGNASHPVGSATVKELYEADGVTLSGHAVDIKVASGTAADTWLYYEGFAPSYANPFYGRGLSTCTGCHSRGSDYVRSPLPSP